MLNVFISDLGRYNAGELTGKWYDMETEEGREEAAQAVADIIEIGSGEYFISDYESDGLKIGEHTPIETVAAAGEILEAFDPELETMVSEINSHNGEFEHLEFYNMSEFEDIVYPHFTENGEPDFFRSVCAMHFGGFNPMHDYFKFDGAMNLESVNEWELQARMRDEAAAIYREWFEITHGITL